MTSLKTFTALAAGAVVLSMAPLASAQTPYGQSSSSSTYNQQPTGQEVFGQILQNLFGGQTMGSLDAEWARGRRALGAQQTTFNGRLDAQVRSGALSSYSADRIRTDYDALVRLEAQYAQDGRFTTQERSELTNRYNALTSALNDGGYGDDIGGYQSAADGRADFEARVTAAVNARTLTRTEATRLRSDYAAIVTAEAQFQRDGLSARERQDIEARLDAIDARVPGGPTGGANGGWQQTPRDRLTAIERALYSLPRGQQDAIRVQFEDLTRLEAAYSRTRPSSDDTAYLERRIGELEVQARIRR
ncbi:hypothetical protein [Brevundimonas sp. NIBR11]|uniref:hypothetical protein n=1 Tax=Brevundimonas sp. NIBR11 TaxID=3015999 RepID=UPI0022F0CE61|nr:hypothetical protein [Brevundimonas sp. NIBR11]WGM30014.1 hypothetical protein KKHFBJBL_00229 [Brevundimonas sp. NIBR11]